MKTIVIDGVEYEVLKTFPCDTRQGEGIMGLTYRPLPKPQKTLVQVAAEATEITEERYRYSYDAPSAVYDAIEERLQALEGRK